MLMVPMKQGDISKTFFLPQEERLHMMPRAKDFITLCLLKQPPSTIFEKCRNIAMTPACPTRTLGPSACFSINSIYGYPGRKPPNISVATAIELELFSPPSEYDPDMMTMYKHISLHSPYALSNPFYEGLFLSSERSYKIFVKQTVKKLMEPPYDTNCFDYLEEWKRNGGRGPMSENDCVQLCKKRIQLSLPDGCLPSNVWYPTNEARCEKRTRWCADFGMSGDEECQLKKRLQTMNETVPEDWTCEKECKPACWQVDYELTKQEAPVVEARKDEGPKKETGITYVTISFQKMEETFYTYKPKYEAVETFSYIGGYVGIWLGVSLLAVLDFLETTVTILKYPFRSKKLVFRMIKRS